MNCYYTHPFLEFFVKKFLRKLRDDVPVDAAKDW